MSTGNQRLGVVTLHYGFNEGAVLQAHALVSLLRTNVPLWESEIVDQRYPSKLAVGGVANEPRTIAIQTAIDEWLPLGPTRWRTNDSDSVKSQLPVRYGALVFGSDQVWCLKYRRRLRSLLGRGILPIQDSPFLPAYPNVYWPDERTPIPQFSFAAAIGGLDWTEIPQRDARAMRRGFEACRLVSVRDERTLRFLEWLDPKLAARATIVADPTFGAPFRASLSDSDARARVRQRLVELGVDFSRPRCALVAGPSAAMQDLADELRRQGIQIVGVTTQNSCCDVNLFEHGFHPLDWARVFGLMDFCVSERMHACIVSILQQTPVVGIDLSAKSGDLETKLRGLLRTFGREDLCLPKSNLEGRTLKNAVRTAQDGAWNWPETGRIVEQLSEIQSNFLQQLARNVSDR